MPRPVVAVTRKLPNVIETRMAELFEVRLNADDHALGPDEIAAAAAGAPPVRESPMSTATAIST